MEKNIYKDEEVNELLKRLYEITKENSDKNCFFFSMFAIDTEHGTRRPKFSFVGSNRDFIESMHNAVSDKVPHSKNLRRIIIKSLLPMWLIQLETRIFRRW